MVETPRRRSGELLGRLLLVIASVAILSLTGKGMRDWWRDAMATFDLSLAGWLPWMAGSVFAGTLFGLACWMPRRFGFQPTAALTLGLIPFIGMITPFAWLHLTWWPIEPFMDLVTNTLFFGFLLGIAVASGTGRSAHRTNTSDPQAAGGGIDDG